VVIARFDVSRNGESDRYHGPHGPIDVVTASDRRLVALEGAEIGRVAVPFGPGSFLTPDAYRQLSRGLALPVLGRTVEVQRRRRRFRFWEWPQTTFVDEGRGKWTLRHRWRHDLLARANGQDLARMARRRWLREAWIADTATLDEVVIFLVSWSVFMPMRELERAWTLVGPDMGA
jgi:hypothetical protein